MPRNNQIDILRSSADIIEEVDGLVTYMGFSRPGTLATSEAKFSIMKITQSAAAYPIVTTFTWANGSCFQDLVWDNRAAYTYKLKNF